MIRGLLLACAAFAPPSRLLLRQAPHAASRAQPIVAQFPGLPLPPGLTAPLSARGAVPCPTDIAVTGFNSRTISANIVIEAAPSAVWQILTDYDRLSSHVPNLVSSYRVPHPRDGIRLYQEGAQNIAGFQFGASLTMDMEETTDDGQREPNRIKFKLVESKMFASFDGEWRMQVFSRRKGPDGGFIYKTKLYYRVAITPKGLVPVPAVRRRPVWRCFGGALCDLGAALPWAALVATLAVAAYYAITEQRTWLTWIGCYSCAGGDRCGWCEPQTALYSVLGGLGAVAIAVALRIVLGIHACAAGALLRSLPWYAWVATAPSPPSTE